MSRSLVPARASLAGYGVLKRRIRETLLLGQREIEDLKVRTYHETGRLIQEHLLQHQDRADYGKQILLKLSKDLGISETVLHRCLQFARQFPDAEIFARGQKLGTLSWSHYRALITVEDEKQRRDYLEKALAKEWTAEELRKKIRTVPARDASQTNGTAKIPELLKPKLGKSGIYQITSIAEKLHWDMGFASYRELSAEESKRLKSGDLVRLTEEGKIAKTLDAVPSDLYHYPVELLKLIDADTFWMKIHLAGADWRKEKLRLRGIDAPELSTSEGQAARRFVDALFKKAESITITTTKPDKWDRYLSDVFLRLPNGESAYLNNRLLEKGFAVRKEKFSFDDWEG